jgi:hypothetical protein
MSLKAKLHNWIYLRRYQSRNMSPAQRFWKRLKLGIALVLTLAVLLVYQSDPFQSLLSVLKAPTLPQVQTQTATAKPLPQEWMAQNWGGSRDKVSDVTHKYHHISQGTSTLSMPYDWFMSLEAPAPSLWRTLFNALFFIKSEPFAADDYLLRFGFIRGQADPTHNPDGLPIGLSKTQSLNIAGLPVKTDGIGFTCAACHTGHLIYGEGDEAKEYIIEGGPATTDLGQLTAAISASLGQTALSSKLPFFDNRFDRFTKKVLGKQYNAQGKALLAAELVSLIEALQKTLDVVKVQEGYGRLDALNRIGNQVFATDLDRRENYQPIDAPVNYPFIWTSSWFKWVQYDASIMQPLVRNVGESIGVSAQVDMLSPQDEGRFQSSVPLDNMVWIENFLKGEAFNQGLTAPAWPFDPISESDENYKFGKDLYQQRCQGCHLPVMSDPALLAHLKPIEYQKNGQPMQTEEKVLDLVIIPQAHIGTDPAQGNILQTRLIDTSGKQQGAVDRQTPGLGLDTVLCGLDSEQVLNNQLFDQGKPKKVELIHGVEINDGGDVNFAFALGATVEQTILAWYNANFISDPKLKEKLSGGRPNCLQAGQGYKARPLNGVWATAPYLHNGSVATIKDLVCKSQQQRPKFVLLGDIRFDADNLGLYQEPKLQKIAAQILASGKLYTDEGYFILDTSLTGNSNQGHSFSDEFDPNLPHDKQPKGVIGEKFTEKECSAILDYLKMI